MKKLFQLLVARRLARTPLGLTALGIGWLLARHFRRRHAEEAAQQPRRAVHPPKRAVHR
ncbi:DUF6203 family protein [Nonomuraea sp. MG754425]|uniref:DUF6203 family protein n=1 Tax=Nonomuraea sp. MG754425 TaxID=2570319 RepID=UPI001F31B07F|nr:DUF6203 family protein [Nonomuraea sp. MG754425]